MPILYPSGWKRSSTTRLTYCSMTFIASRSWSVRSKKWWHMPLRNNQGMTRRDWIAIEECYTCCCLTDNLYPTWQAKPLPSGSNVVNGGWRSNQAIRVGDNHILMTSYILRSAWDCPGLTRTPDLCDFRLNSIAVYHSVAMSRPFSTYKPLIQHVWAAHSVPLARAP